MYALSRKTLREKRKERMSEGEKAVCEKREERRENK